MAQLRFYVPDLHCGGCVKRFSSAMDMLDSDEFQCDPLQRQVVFKLKTSISVEALKKSMLQNGFPAYLLVDSAKQQKKELHYFLKRIFVAALGMMQVMMLSIAIYLEKDMPDTWKQVFHWFSFFVTTPVMLYAGKPFFYSALTALMRKKVNMDVPVALALIVAYGFSFLSLVQGGKELYFDSINMFLFFLTLGRFAQWQASFKTQEANEALWADMPAEVILVTPAGDIVKPLSEIRPKDQVRVQQGMQFPVDGDIVAGETLVDESMLTGESHPVVRGVGDQVYAGTVNQTQSVLVHVNQVQGATQLGHIQRLLFEAQDTKPAIAQYVDRLAGIFILSLLVLAACVGAAWWWVDPSRVVPIIVSVLIVTCPCALSLATPAAIASTLARLTRDGIVVTQGDALEKANFLTRLVFDKTGTLTSGQFCIEQVQTIAPEMTEERALEICAALELQSDHPLAEAFSPFLSADTQASELQIIPGEGVTGVVDGQSFVLGAHDKLMQKYNFTLSSELVTHLSEVGAVCTLLLLYNITQSGPSTVFSLRSETRPEAAGVLESLSAYPRVLLSGDHELPVRALAYSLRIPTWYSRATPASKQQIIEQFQLNGEKVLMVGDGVNDGPVLVQADIGIALGQGTALAKASADVVLMHDNLNGLSFFLKMAKKCQRTVRQNIYWAIGYNAIAIPFAAIGLVPPWLAAIGMSASSLLVVLNSLRLLRVAPNS